MTEETEHVRNIRSLVKNLERDAADYDDMAKASTVNRQHYRNLAAEARSKARRWQREAEIEAAYQQQKAQFMEAAE